MNANHQATSFENLIERLEAERVDISYRNLLPKPLVKVETKVVKTLPESLKKVYFHAGRYAAGDRDRVASEAWAAYAKKEQLD
jgi:hypothetical protein